MFNKIYTLHQINDNYVKIIKKPIQNTTKMKNLQNPTQNLQTH